MPFGTIVSGTKSFEPRSPGTYTRSTVTFGQPLDEFRIKGAVQSKDGILRSSVTRVLEKDIVVAGSTIRRNAVVTLSIASPSVDYSGTELDDLASDISTFITAASVSRLLQGES